MKNNVLNTDLYGLTAEIFSLGRSNIDVIQEMIAGKIQIIQYREKEKKMIEKYNECLEIRKLTKEANVTFIINDDIHLALAVDADGVHIGQEDLPIEVVRKILGKDKIIGLSTHNPKQAKDAERRGADYIGVGPIFTTKTKKDVCDAVGFEYLNYVAKNISIPFVAIGGIKSHNIIDVAKQGATCVALVTEIVGADNIQEKIQELRSLIHSSTL